MKGLIEGQLEAAGYAKVDLRRSGTGQLLATVKVEGSELLMALDSGASATVVDRQSAADAHLSGLVAGEGAAGAGGRLETHTAPVQDVALGAVPLTLSRVAVMDLSHVNDQLVAVGEVRVDGVVGADVLGVHEALIDYGGPSLYLRTPAP